VSVPHPARTSTFTAAQGQYLAFIYAYATIHRQAPAEADLRRFFRVTAPSVHRMVLELEQRGFIRRVPRTARSIALLVPPEDLPILRDVATTRSIRTSVHGY
jgi:DNA-binding MarR family transcriptional regulator